MFGILGVEPRGGANCMFDILVYTRGGTSYLMAELLRVAQQRCELEHRALQLRVDHLAACET